MRLRLKTFFARKSALCAGRASAGYTLIELAIVVGVLGLLSSGVLAIAASKIEQTNMTKINVQMDKIQDALAHYTNWNATANLLPCPAVPTALENAAAFGRAAATPGTCTGTVTFGAGASALSIGVVPTRSLGLPDRMMFDPWGSRIWYVVIQQLTAAGTSAAYATPNAIRILDGSGTQINPSLATHITSYVLISAGPDKQGAYSANATLKAATQALDCSSAATKDVENCNGDNIFRDMPIQYTKDQAQLGNYYYDIIRWKIMGM